MSVGDDILGFFRRTDRVDGDAPDRQEPPSPAPTPTSADSSLSSDDGIKGFAKKIRDTLKSDGHVVAGTVQMLVLDKLRQHFGDGWDEVAEKIHIIISNTIERALGSRDAYIRFQGQTYVIVFAGLKSDMAAMKAALIAEEITRRIFGEAVKEPVIQIGIAVIKDNAIAQVEKIDPQALIASMVTKATAAGNVIELASPDAAPQADPPPPGPSITATSEPPPLSRADAYGRTAAAGKSEPHFDWRTSRRGDGKEPENEWRPIRRHENDLEAIPDDMTFVYSPAWLVKGNVISAHTCVPARLDYSGRLVSGGQAMPSNCATPINFSLDVLALTKVVNDLAALNMRNKLTMVVLPVHYQTLDWGRHQNKFLRVAATLPHSTRKQLLIELMGVSDQTPSTKLAEAVAALRPLCRDLLIRTRLESPSFSLLRSVNVHAVGVDLTNIPLAEKEIFPYIERFNATARKMRLYTFAHGAHTRSLLSGAVASGFRYLDGSAIATSVMKPAPNRSWTVKNVYSSLLQP